jgi:two-component system aerobic respiration control sensor histidine kinase ArcB
MLKANLMPQVSQWFRRNREENTIPLCIMVISDDEECMMAISNALLEKGCDAVATSNVLEALLILDERGLPDLLIGDFKTPQVDGKTLIEKMRIRFGRRSLPPIVFLLDSPEDEEMALELGIDDVVPKAADAPATIEALWNVIDHLDQKTQ